MLFYFKYFWFNGNSLPIQLIEQLMVEGTAGEEVEKEEDSTEGMSSVLTKGNMTIG